MSDPLQVARDVLTADATVTGLVGTRISPVIASQGIATPYITLQVLSTNPENHLRGFASLDRCQLIITAWAETYASAQAIGSACRSAMETAGHLCESRNADQYDPDPDPGLYHTEHQFSMWL